MELTKGKIAVGILCVALAVALAVANIVNGSSPKTLAERSGVLYDANADETITVLADQFDTPAFETFLDALGVSKSSFREAIERARESERDTVELTDGEGYRITIVMSETHQAPLGVIVAKSS